MDELVLSCLAKEPDDRPSAGELSQSLAALDVEPWNEVEAKDWWETRGSRENTSLARVASRQFGS
jgi:hypothetical protein